MKRTLNIGVLFPRTWDKDMSSFESHFSKQRLFPVCALSLLMLYAVPVTGKTSSATGTATIIQQKTAVKGRVTDVSGAPLVGVTVQEKNTKGGTITDAEGQFRLSVSQPVVTLTFTYVGYVSQEVEVNTSTLKKALNVVMKEFSQSLNEVVVVGYGTQQ